jgi:porphobilinogen synthase
MMKITERPRRLRKNSSLRDAVTETELKSSHLVWPVFIKDGLKSPEAIASLPGCSRHGLDTLCREIQSLHKKGLKAVALFPCIEENLKNKKASEALNSSGLVPKTVRRLKKEFPDLNVITDIALDPFSSDGHDGLVKDGEILNDETVALLAEMATLHASAGADFVGPSDMMDGRVGAIRKAMDGAGFVNTGIISYTAKYASAFYGPFREALDSAPKFGDKKTYQMNPANGREALREARLDVKEGADLLMVKPALAYLDVIAHLKAKFDVPIAAYNVSGEYAMVKAAGEKGWLDEKKITLEILLSIRRAGASMIFTYHAPEVLSWI